MATTFKEVLGTLATLLSTELNSLTSTSSVVSSVIAATGIYNNQAGSGLSTTTGDGYERGYLTLNLAALGGNPTANTSVDIYFLKSWDGGTTFEDGTSAILPTARPDASFQMDSSRATAYHQMRVVFLPGVPFKILAKNNGTGQTLNASGNTLTLLPATDQGV